MPSYIVYSLNSEGHSLGFDMFEAEDDQAAIADCHRRAKHHALELWREGRKIARINGQARIFPSHLA